MTPDDVDVSEAVVLYLEHYPGRNDTVFDAHFAENAAAARHVVRRMLEEVMALHPDWSEMSLQDAGDHVEAEMHARHPELSPPALTCLGNYFTFLMR
ncbi:hypothetical protein [Mycolicibacterium sediminis]|uniref:Uncharacterized protein n=1 Tax=Mycolicibacterium sediminis TaxID=1286180 RepID=A0A7I7QS58_9MYCO|nr:hypothetical protein [Mycolicibacterium sediminis]BBY28666.1 hypothetical protein MSEDJ_27620 [Mycolicibacterium sediminis]